MIHTKQFWLKFLIMTGVVWIFYAGLLPIYFYFVFGWGWSEITLWWITGTPVEFILAYPLTRIIVYVEPRVNQITKQEIKNESKKAS